MTVVDTVLFDTSVLVAAIVQSHPHHGRAFPWLRRALAGDIAAVVSAHSLAELYAVLTALPVRPRIAPATAWSLIAENVTRRARVVALEASEVEDAVRRTAELGLLGGVTYDALHLAAARKAGAGAVLTLNVRDFRRLAPDPPPEVVEP